MKKATKSILSMALAFTMLGSVTACGASGADNTELLDKITSLETQVSDLQTALDDYMAEEVVNPNALAANYGAEAYEMVKYIDAVAKDRDSIAGDKYQFVQKWIMWNLISAGYVEGEDVTYHNFTWTKYYKSDVNLEETITASKYTTDGKLYKRSGRNYVEAAEGTHVKADITGSNIVVT